MLLAQQYTNMNNLKTYHFIYTTILLILIFGCHSKNIEGKKEENFKITDSLLKTLVIDTVKAPNNKVSLNFSGYISVNEEEQSVIYPMVSGIVNQVNAEIGDKVSKGEKLAVLSSGDMYELNNELIQAKASLRNTERALQQAESLFNSGLSSAKEFEEAKSEVIIKKSELEKIQSKLKINGDSKNGLYNVSAPISGYIIDKKINTHSQIRADNNDYLFKIANLSSVWAIINIYESELANLKEGDEVNVSVLTYPDKIFKGKINRIYQTINSDTKVINARIKIENSELLLKPGMMANINVFSKSTINLPSVTAKAIVFDNNKNYALVLDQNHKIRIQTIEIGAKSNDQVFINNGLKANDKVIASNQVFIFESLKN